MMIQLYHPNDTTEAAVTRLARPPHAAGTPPAGAAGPAVIRQDGPLCGWRGGARPSPATAGAAARRRAGGVRLVHRARSPPVASDVSLTRGAGRPPSVRRKPALFRTRAGRARVHRGAVALRRGGGRDPGRHPGRSAAPLLGARDRGAHARRVDGALV